MAIITKEKLREYFITRWNESTEQEFIDLIDSSANLSGDNLFYGNISATAFYGDGSNLTGLNIPEPGSTEYLPLSGGTITGAVSSTSNINAAYFYGDGSNLDGVATDIELTTLVSSTSTELKNNYTSLVSGVSTEIIGYADTNFLFLSGGTLTGAVSSTSSINAEYFYGDGSNLTNINVPELSGYLPLSGGVLTGSLSSTSNISAAYFYGDGSNLSGLNIPEPNLTGYLPLSGGTLTGAVSSTSSISAQNLYADTTVQFNTIINTTPDLGHLAWHADDATLDLGLGAEFGSLSIGEETLYRVKNNTSSDIVKGTVVQSYGVSPGGSGRLQVAPATATGIFPSKYIMGLAKETIPANGEGYVTHFGKIKDINTEQWGADGTVLYADPNTFGGLTSSTPLSPNNKVTVAVIVKSNNPNGTLFVRPSFEGKLDDNESVIINNLQNNDLLIYNSALSAFENKTPPFLFLSGGTLTGPVSAPTLSADTIYVGNSSIYFQSGAKIQSSETGTIVFSAISATAVTISGTDVLNEVTNHVAKFMGPICLNEFRSYLFSPSSYAPGIAFDSNPSDFGFFELIDGQNGSALFSPTKTVGINKNFRIHLHARYDNVINDGVHLLIRYIDPTVGEYGVPGLLDVHTFGEQYINAISDTMNSGTDPDKVWYFKTYFAAYNGSNSALIQDVTLWIEPTE